MSDKKIFSIAILYILLIAGCQSMRETSVLTAVPSKTLDVTAEPSPEPLPTDTLVQTLPLLTAEASVLTETVDIKLFLYQPKAITVTAGTTVSWFNYDDIQHTVTNGTPENPDNAFDSGFFFQDETYSFTFLESGTYQYFCRRHNHMQGIVKVLQP